MKTGCKMLDSWHVLAWVASFSNRAIPLEPQFPFFLLITSQAKGGSRRKQSFMLCIQHNAQSFTWFHLMYRELPGTFNVLGVAVTSMGIWDNIEGDRNLGALRNLRDVIDSLVSSSIKAWACLHRVHRKRMSMPVKTPLHKCFFTHSSS